MFSSNTSAVSADATYIEDVFSTWLYTGTSAAQTIPNGIDLSTKGGLIWTKSRSDGSQHQWCDTARGINKFLRSEVTNGQYTSSSNTLTSFNSNGYTMGADSTGNINYTGINYASWTFRKQPKFFDVVTWTGDGNASKTISHSLGSVPGCIITKSSSTVNNWFTYHRSLGNTQGIALNLTNAAGTNSGYWNNTSPTSTNFTVGSFENASGETYVAYLFAHDAGGFGLTGTDNVISCGAYTGNGSSTGPTVTLGYEPQWVLIKNATFSGAGWLLFDNMRGMTVTDDAALLANTSGSEFVDQYIAPTATGFNVQGTYTAVNGNGDTMVYIAIRRGPMKTPTSGTSVFSPAVSSGATGTALTTNFPIDLQMINLRTGNSTNTSFVSRLTGSNSNANNNTVPYLVSSSTAAEVAASFSRLWDNTGFQMPSYFGGSSSVFYSFRRAPGFFDVVCYPGTGGSQTVSHNLGVAPELVIFKGRGSPATNWIALVSSLSKFGYLNNTLAVDNDPVTYFTTNGSTYAAPTATSLFLNNLNVSTYVAYLFASCPGVSKVGTYTGTGNTLQVNCGFTGGARFVLIKRTDSTGDWYVWDSARGIVSGNDPYLLLNSTAAEVTNTDYVDTYSAGFEISSTAPAAINANGGTFVFLAVA